MRRVAGASGVRSGTGGRKRTGPVGRRTAHPARRLAWLLPPSTIHWPLDTRHITDSSYKLKFQFPLPILHPIRRFPMVRRNSRILPADDRGDRGDLGRLGHGPTGPGVLPASFCPTVSPALPVGPPLSQPTVRVQPSSTRGLRLPACGCSARRPAPPLPRYRSTLTIMADTEPEKKVSAEEQITGRSSASGRALPQPTKAFARAAPPAPGCRFPLLTVLCRNAAAG